jgi:hypothetical protein
MDSLEWGQTYNLKLDRLRVEVDRADFLLGEDRTGCGGGSDF